MLGIARWETRSFNNIFSWAPTLTLLEAPWICRIITADRLSPPKLAAVTFAATTECIPSLIWVKSFSFTLYTFLLPLAQFTKKLHHSYRHFTFVSLIFIKLTLHAFLSPTSLLYGPASTSCNLHIRFVQYPIQTLVSHMFRISTLLKSV